MTLVEAAEMYANEFQARLAILEEYRDVDRRLRNANRYVASALLKVRVAAEKECSPKKRTRRVTPRDPAKQEKRRT